MPVPNLADAVGITGVGMVSSLGCDVVTACAAARAGLVRSQALDYFPVRSPVDGVIAGVTGHPVPELTRGFEGFARLLRLVQAALADLQKQLPHTSWSSGHSAFYLSLPDPRRVYTGLALIQDEDSRQGRSQAAAEAQQRPLDDDIGLRLLHAATHLTGWPGVPLVQFLTVSGHTGIAEALGRALQDLRAGQVELAIVGGVDSLLEEGTLAWLENTGRLKTSGVPAGLQPGEAGVFLLLETVPSARARRHRVFGMVQEVCFGRESKPLLSGDPPVGDGLTEVLHSLLHSAGWRDGQPVWFITDQNGEPYRAMEWGNVVVRLVGVSKAFAEPILWYPAASFGDTGAVSGAVALCMAVNAFARGYAPAQTVAILSSAEDSSRAAVLLTMAGIGREGEDNGRPF